MIVYAAKGQLLRCRPRAVLRPGALDVVGEALQGVRTDR
jgi:hypothetical protein